MNSTAFCIRKDDQAIAFRSCIAGGHIHEISFHAGKSVLDVGVEMLRMKALAFDIDQERTCACYFSSRHSLSPGRRSEREIRGDECKNENGHHRISKTASSHGNLPENSYGTLDK